MKVYGPYLCKDGRRRMVLKSETKKTSMSYAKYLLQEKLGRLLLGDETADHIDENPSNDVADNLQPLSRSENAKKWHRYVGTTPEMVAFVCPQCGSDVVKPARYVRHNRRQGKAGPFCGKSCAGKYSASVG